MLSDLPWVFFGSIIDSSRWEKWVLGLLPWYTHKSLLFAAKHLITLFRMINAELLYKAELIFIYLNIEHGLWCHLCFLRSTAGHQVWETLKTKKMAVIGKQVFYLWFEGRRVLLGHFKMEVPILTMANQGPLPMGVNFSKMILQG